MKAEMEAHLTAYLKRLLDVNEKAERHVDVAEVFGWRKPSGDGSTTKVGGQKRKFEELEKGNKPHKTSTTSAPQLCKGCGRVHSGVCQFKDHPDYNREPVPWTQSRHGLAWMKIDPKQKRLHPGRRLTQDMQSSVPYRDDKVSTLSILALSNNRTDDADAWR
jgi:predicted Fe-S protein YdhL (DUF1289 family)